jgi:hypothetical protein
MRPLRRRRRGEAAQSLVELALMLPTLLVLVLGFAGAILVMDANTELKAATGLATESAFSVPVGQTEGALHNISDSLQRSVHSSFVVPGTLKVNCPREEGNEYIYGHYHAGTKVSCHADATLSFSHSIVGLVWRWDVGLHQDAQEQAPPFRQCAPGTTC